MLVHYTLHNELLLARNCYPLHSGTHIFVPLSLLSLSTRKLRLNTFCSCFPVALRVLKPSVRTSKRLSGVLPGPSWLEVRATFKHNALGECPETLGRANGEGAISSEVHKWEQWVRVMNRFDGLLCQLLCYAVPPFHLHKAVPFSLSVGRARGKVGSCISGSGS